MGDGEEDPSVVFQPLCDEKLPPKLKVLIDPKLQRYIHEPPGPGMAVIYVEVSPSGKMYVGQHIHGVEGKSYYKTRFKAKLKFSGTPAIHNAFKKYGIENMRSFIIFHCKAGNKQFVENGDSNHLEEWGVSSLDTISPNGYNIRFGGLNAEWHQESKQKVKDFWANPQNKTSQIEKIKHALDNPEARARKRQAAKDCCDEDLREVRRANMLNRSSELKDRIVDIIRSKNKLQDQELLNSKLIECGNDELLKEQVLLDHSCMLERKQQNAEKQARYRERKKRIANGEQVSFDRYTTPENDQLRIQRLQETVKAKDDAKLKQALDSCGDDPSKRRKIINTHEKWLENKRKDKEAKAKRRMKLKAACN